MTGWDHQVGANVARIKIPTRTDRGLVSIVDEADSDRDGIAGTRHYHAAPTLPSKVHQISAQRALHEICLVSVDWRVRPTVQRRVRRPRTPTAGAWKRWRRVAVYHRLLTGYTAMSTAEMWLSLSDRRVTAGYFAWQASELIDV